MSATSIIRAALVADVPVLIWGPPGTGKTATLVDMAATMGAHLEILIGSTIDPTDVGGWLVPDATGQVTSSPPPWARRLRAALDAGRRAWLLLDELSTAPPSVQAALLRVVNERRVGEVDLTGCRIIAAANRAEHAADNGILAAATSNRWSHVEWTVSHTEWSSGLLRNWGRPQPDGWGAAAGSIAAWIHASPAALLDTRGDMSGAWPSPRSWTAAARLLTAVEGRDKYSAVASCVGTAAASEWAAHAAAGDLPDPEKVLCGTAAWPQRGDQILATALGVVSCAVQEHEQRESRIDAAAELLAGLRPDVAIPAAAALVDAVDTVPDALLALADKITASRRRMAAS